MRQSILAFSLVLLSTFTLFGQTQTKKVDLEWGPDQKASKKATLSDIIGYDETGIYTLKSKAKVMAFKQELTLEHYDKKLNQTKSVPLEIKQDKKDLYIEFFVQMDEEIYIFSSFKNQKIKKNFLFYQQLNKATLQPKGSLTKIAEIDYSGKSKYNSGNYDFSLSRDSSKILVYYDLPYDKGESERYGFHVFDSGMNQLWHKEITLPYLEQLFNVEDYGVDNDGNVHLLGVIYKEKPRVSKRGKPNYKYQILSYYNSGDEMIEYPVQITGKFITDMQIAINLDKDIICAGFYSNEGTTSIEGSYFLKIDSKTKEIKTKEFHKFGLDFITQNMTEREEKKTKKKAAKGKDVELYEYDLDDILIRDDGGAVLVGEQYYVRTVTTTSTDANGNTTTRTTYYYYYNDIIVINISPEGKIEWTVKVPKKQVTTNDGGFYSSYALAVVKDKLYFVFNDHPKNLFYKEGKLSRFNKGKESLVVLVTLDSNGEQTREALFSSQDVEVLTRPKVCEQIGQKEMILFGQRKKNHRFARITFKD